MGRKIALVGTCASRDLALQLPPEWECWVCSPGNDKFPRIDLFFELHGDLDFPGENWWPYLNWLNAQTFPVMVHRQDLIPRGEVFPIERMVKEFGDYFFTSQPALMIAYAITQQPEEIGLFGLDMQAKSEYAHQKPSMLHFVWLAMLRGITVMAPDESEAIVAPPIYGYNLMSPMARKLRARNMEVRQQIAQMERDKAILEARLMHFRGVLDENDWALQTWTGGLYRETGEVHQVAKPQLVKEA